jgi:tRNA (guanine10-N2)-dimethyltransferase
VRDQSPRIARPDHRPWGGHAARGEPRERRFLVWLWGRDHELARAEVEALTRQTPVPLGPGLVAVSVPAGGAALLGRLGHSKMVLRCLGWSATHQPPFDPAAAITGSFAVRVHRLLDVGRDSGSGAGRELERAIAGDLWRRLPAPRVDLHMPDAAIHVFVTAGGLWWGRLTSSLDAPAFTARRPTSRPFWRSTAMAPRKARCLVNLSGVRRGGRLLDPFCGTGSIPIEAALMGVRTLASDIDPAVVAGAARNVAALGLQRRIELRRRDARAWGACGLRFDAIVSDLPYGRAAAVRGAARDELYRGFLDVTAEILRPGGRAVLMAAEGTLPAPPPRLRLVRRFPEIVHGSLTREVVVFESVPQCLGAAQRLPRTGARNPGRSG